MLAPFSWVDLPLFDAFVTDEATADTEAFLSRNGLLYIEA